MKIMSEQVIRKNKDFDLYCAVVDARGNEIYYSQFDKKNNIILILVLFQLNKSNQLLTKSRNIFFLGDAVEKLEVLLVKKNKFLKEIYPSASDMGQSLTKNSKTKILKF